MGLRLPVGLDGPPIIPDLLGEDPLRSVGLRLPVGLVGLDGDVRPIIPDLLGEEPVLSSQSPPLPLLMALLRDEHVGALGSEPPRFTGDGAGVSMSMLGAAVGTPVGGKLPSWRRRCVCRLRRCFSLARSSPSQSQWQSQARSSGGQSQVQSQPSWAKEVIHVKPPPPAAAPLPNSFDEEESKRSSSGTVTPVPKSRAMAAERSPKQISRERIMPYDFICS